MKSIDLRKKFFEFFEKRGHEKVASSSLIPAEDPTLLFTNAGMNQFKDVLLGKEKRSYKRAVTIQKCVRAGGKHNDLEAVGFTARHLTFFEMMGNFSFGDYFKKDAIQFAWDFITQEVEFAPEKLFVTVHYSDKEAREIWEKQIGIPSEKVFELDEDNFWQMGDVGPCGPCTEIFFDRGPGAGCGEKDCSPACDCDRFLEIWNVVFMQYNMLEGGTKEELKQKGVDTGMGLERLAMIAQDKDSVFDIDAFQISKKKIEELTGKKYNQSAEVQAAFNVLFDHVRSATFLISDGCAPSNEGRGYVLRKIIRRAALFAQKLTDKNIFPQVSESFIEEMKEIYPDLVENKKRIVAVLTSEIEKFSDNLVRGKRILEGYFSANKDKKISGEQTFKLYDTYGFPVELVIVMAQEEGFVVDRDGFEEHMEKQRLLSGKKMKKTKKDFQINENIVSEFTGYEKLEESSSVVGILKNDAMEASASKGDEVWLIAEKTPFFVECGGQVDDHGKIIVHGKSMDLLGLQKIDNAILMHVKLAADISIGDKVDMKVDEHFRLHTMKNHTATHLLQAALQAVLGSQVKQAGSVVTRDYLRFDYTHHQPLTVDEIKKIERLVNEKIWENIPLTVEHTTYKDAISRGIIAFFGDKYNHDDVRAVIVPGFSSELCGGTHVRATGDIGIFKIVEESALAAGQRRIVALTGGKALETFQDDFSVVKTLSQKLKTKADGVLGSIEKLDVKLRDLQKKIKSLKTEQWKCLFDSWAVSIEKVKDISFLYLQLDDYEFDDVRAIVKKLQSKQPGFYFIFNAADGDRGQFLCSLDKSLTSNISLADFKKVLQDECGLKGGGNDTTLQGGGSVSSASKDAIIKLLTKIMK